MIVIVMMSVALASDPCGAQIILLRLLLLLMMMMMGITVLYQFFCTDALGKVALNGETLKLLSVCGSEVN